ncbi:transcriptional regulator, MerR family [Thermincola ferriacetica]|uniref:Transcriptional regulator, MerR family n=1 Tax=Thermincola ferriacetica TaxID=281456 RepID=A0A0L6W3N6_9FIRM|nr:MerR family transcriptional regulator [Thermincola ferriacetica]KNZ69973.1 transcriptional regulator, MerR family [Thermincola ferriacetica]
MVAHVSSNEGVYQISIAAHLAGVNMRTLRQWEEAGLIKPSRTQGNTRLYSSDDIDIIKRIKFLVEEKGVNLPGVKLIIQLEDKYGRDITGSVK